MSFEIRVNNQTFTLWESASIRRSIDTNTGLFSFTSSVTMPPVDYPVKAGDFVQILIKGTPRITGYVDVMNTRQNIDNHHINVNGRDNVQDLIDSSIPDEAKNITGPINAIALCERMISAIGADIQVINNSGQDLQFTNEDLFNAGSGETIMAYLTSFMRKKQVYLITDGRGNLVIFRPTGATATTSIEHSGSPQDNVKSFSATWDHQQLFNRYVSRSQDNFAFNFDADYSNGEGVDRSGDIVDDNIRTTRYLEVQSEQTLLQTEVTGRAAEEANVRRARAVEYTVEVQGAAQEDGTLWDIGQLVDVRDDYAGIRGVMLIRSIENRVSIRDGVVTTLTLALPDAYTVQGAPTQQNERRANRGSRFENVNPTRRQRFTR